LLKILFSIGVTILLAFFVNILVISNYTPEASSDQPVIGKNNLVFILKNFLSTF
jgi:hypothetical protein